MEPKYRVLAVCQCDTAKYRVLAVCQCATIRYRVLAVCQGVTSKIEGLSYCASVSQVRYWVLAVCQCATSRMISDESKDVSKSPLSLEKAQKKKLRGGGGGISAWLWRMSRHLSSRDNKKKMYSEKDKSWHSPEAAGVFGIFWWLTCPMPAWMQSLAMHPTAQA